MTVTSGKQYAVGMRHAQIFALDADGYPNAPSTTAYEGLEIVGAKAFDVTIPDARRIFHTGNDRLLAQDFLPVLEGASAVLRASRNDYDVYAVLTGTNEATIGEAKVIGYGTDQQGSEPDVGMLLFQQSKDGTAKTRRWRAYILPVTNAIIKAASMNDSPAEYEFQILPQVVSAHLWGVTFSASTEGFTEAQLVETMTTTKPWIASWAVEAASDTVYLFNTARKATSTAKIHAVALEGTALELTTDYTATTAGITLVATPAAGEILVAFYEIAN